MWRRRWPTRSVRRPRCPSRRFPVCARPSATSSTPGAPAGSPTWNWTTCSWLARTSRCTQTQGDVKAAYWAMFDIPADTAPNKAEALVQQRIHTFAGSYNKTYPAAVRCLLDDQQALTAYLRFPREHWPRIRHSNFIERTFGETSRRTKVIGRLTGETR